MEYNRRRSTSNISEYDSLCQIYFTSFEDDLNRLKERHNADVEYLVDKIRNTGIHIRKLGSSKFTVPSTDETRKEDQIGNIVTAPYRHQGQDEKSDYRHDSTSLVRLPSENERSDDRHGATAPARLPRVDERSEDRHGATAPARLPREDEKSEDKHGATAPSRLRREDGKSEEKSSDMALIKSTGKNDEHGKRTDGHKSFQSPQSQPNKELAGQTTDVKMLLIGCLGNGKSATANTILGKNIFPTSSSTSTRVGDITATIGKGSTVIGGRTVEIIDGPGISVGNIDTHFIDDLKKVMDKSLELCNYECSAILLVLKFGIRFTMQESETTRLVKSFLGKNVIRDLGICVITFGDSFEHAVEEAHENGDNLTFESWCRSQPGEVQSLFEECSYRCVLFDNKTKDETIRNTQVNKLIHYAMRNKQYYKEQFAAINGGLNELRLEARLPEINADIIHYVETVRRDVNTANTRHPDNPKNNPSELENLFDEVRQKRSTVERELNGSSSLRSSLLPLSVLESDISRSICEVKILKVETDIRNKNHTRSLSQNVSNELMSKTDKRYDRPSSTVLSNKRDSRHTDRKGTVRK